MEGFNVVENQTSGSTLNISAHRTCSTYEVRTNLHKIRDWKIIEHSHNELLDRKTELYEFNIHVSTQRMMH